MTKDELARVSPAQVEDALRYRVRKGLVGGMYSRQDIALRAGHSMRNIHRWLYEDHSLKADTLEQIRRGADALERRAARRAA